MCYKCVRDKKAAVPVFRLKVCGIGDYFSLDKSISVLKRNQLTGIHFSEVTPDFFVHYIDEAGDGYAAGSYAKSFFVPLNAKTLSLKSDVDEAIRDFEKAKNKLVNKLNRINDKLKPYALDEKGFKELLSK